MKAGWSFCYHPCKEDAAPCRDWSPCRLQPATISSLSIPGASSDGHPRRRTPQQNTLPCEPEQWRKRPPSALTTLGVVWRAEIINTLPQGRQGGWPTTLVGVCRDICSPLDEASCRHLEANSDGRGYRWRLAGYVLHSKFQRLRIERNGGQ